MASELEDMVRLTECLAEEANENVVVQMEHYKETLRTMRTLARQVLESQRTIASLRARCAALMRRCTPQAVTTAADEWWWQDDMQADLERAETALQSIEHTIEDAQHATRPGDGLFLSQRETDEVVRAVNAWRGVEEDLNPTTPTPPSDNGKRGGVGKVVDAVKGVVKGKGGKQPKVYKPITKPAPTLKNNPIEQQPLQPDASYQGAYAELVKSKSAAAAKEKEDSNAP